MGKFTDAIMGLVVGDAVGVPFEFRKRDTFTADDMTGYGTYGLPAGTWSDDSSMTIATVDSIAEHGKINPEAIMRNFWLWYYHEHFTPFGEVFDVGGTTRQAIHRYATGFPVSACGGKTDRDNGNGALMRILPLAFYPGSLADVITVASLTHNHRISNTACALYVAIARFLMTGMDAKRAILEGFEKIGRVMPVPDELCGIPFLFYKKRHEIKSTGYVVDTLEAALWCVAKSTSYLECVLMAVNLGEDTDTVAAVAGGLAGIIYGIGGKKGIPEEWIAQIAQKEKIAALCERFENKIMA